MLTGFNNLGVLWDGQCQLGEGPLYCPSTRSVYWVDIRGSALPRVSLTGGVHTNWQFASSPTRINHHVAGGFILTMQKGFALWLGDDAAPTPLAGPESDMPGNRFNDVTTDRVGRLWAGTMDEAGRDDTGSLYRFALAPDGYVGNNTIFIRIDPDHGYPDGMTFAQDGDIWVCHFFGGRVSRYGSEGQLKRQYRLPVSNTTSCAFVGSGLQQLAITTARKALSPEQLEREPLAGALFLADVDDATGIPVRAYGR